ncbi:nucleoside-binding protein [Alteromonas pelagimontana]|uniref:Nucleoside-binding protein n=1 Tax=Alteromonas pelagimontana TaxID=1858656 RepID=A0A6M4MDL3_9ALTE|nr:hypothetical protein [Alteromonas pelagimontana]QJR80720.1 nucleoside-binding protein [Alteromonas pelagimontana]
MIRLTALLFLTACQLWSPIVKAATNWTDASLTYLNGNNYELGDNQRQVLTLEYASGASWGDNFIFVDRLESSDGNHATYVEANPRIRLFAFDSAVVKNLYFTPTGEFGDETNWLYGLGTDLALPHFRYAKLSVYYKDNGNGATNEQATLAFAVPFLENFLYDGFVDIMSAYRRNDGLMSSSQFNATTQLKYNLDRHFNLSTRLYVGIEYVYWNNKFGVSGVNERNVNFLLKYHF